MRVIGIDLECDDPFLKEKGVSWVYNEGSILCTSLYYEDTKEKIVHKGCPKLVKSLLLDPDVLLVGANIVYDLGWIEHHHKIKGQTKATLADVLIAEGMIDEYGRHNLDALCKKYLRRGKKTERVKEWLDDAGYRGDFRKHLKHAPYDLLEEYALDDSELPVLIYRKQEKLLQEQDLLKAFELDCNLLKVVLKMKQRGVRIDEEKRKQNREKLEKSLGKRKKKFIAKYGKVNLNSSKQVAALMDSLDIPYKVKFTVKGKGGKTYGWEDLKEGLNALNDVTRGFKRDKNKLVCYVPKEHRHRMASLLERNGFHFIANPNVDKKFRASIADEYPVGNAIQEIKQASDILSKVLGDGFERFIVNGRVHPDFNVALTDNYGTISGRLSSSNPNMQQIPSKGTIRDVDNKELDLAELCRGIIVPEEDCWLLKIDYSQIEYRLLVHYAVGKGAVAARQKFIEDPKTDYHQFVMGLTGLSRKFAKNCNFGIMYGMGLGGMMSAFSWDKEKAQEILDTYNSSLPYVKSTMAKVSEVSLNRGYIKTIGGRRARLRNKDMTYTMLNRLNQGGSADIMKAAMVKADEEGLFDILIAHITVHDELVCSVPKTKEGIAAVLKLKEIMENAVTLKVPIKADPELGNDWHNVVDMRDFEEIKRG